MSKENIGLTGGEENKDIPVVTEMVSLNSEYGFFYRSDRDLPLMYRKKPLDKPILTVEHYCKWYDLFLVMPNGTVKSVKDEFIDEYYAAEEAFGAIIAVDHTYNPEFIPVLAHYLDAYMDSEALEVIVGRWAMETMDQYHCNGGTGFMDDEDMKTYIQDCRKKE